MFIRILIAVLLTASVAYAGSFGYGSGAGGGGGAPSGSAGGDLSGTYPNPEVTGTDCTGTEVLLGDGTCAAQVGTDEVPVTGEILQGDGAGISEGSGISVDPVDTGELIGVDGLQDGVDTDPWLKFDATGDTLKFFLDQTTTATHTFTTGVGSDEVIYAKDYITSTAIHAGGSKTCGIEEADAALDTRMGIRGGGIIVFPQGECQPEETIDICGAINTTPPNGRSYIGYGNGRTDDVTSGTAIEANSLPIGDPIIDCVSGSKLRFADFTLNGRNRASHGLRLTADVTGSGTTPIIQAAIVERVTITNLYDNDGASPNIDGTCLAIETGVDASDPVSEVSINDVRLTDCDIGLDVNGVQMQNIWFQNSYVIDSGEAAIKMQNGASVHIDNTYFKSSDSADSSNTTSVDLVVSTGDSWGTLRNVYVETSDELTGSVLDVTSTSGRPWRVDHMRVLNRGTSADSVRVFDFDRTNIVVTSLMLENQTATGVAPAFYWYATDSRIVETGSVIMDTSSTEVGGPAEQLVRIFDDDVTYEQLDQKVKVNSFQLAKPGIVGIDTKIGFAAVPGGRPDRGANSGGYAYELVIDDEQDFITQSFDGDSDDTDDTTSTFTTGSLSAYQGQNLSITSDEATFEELACRDNTTPWAACGNVTDAGCVSVSGLNDGDTMILRDVSEERYYTIATLDVDTCGTTGSTTIDLLQGAPVAIASGDELQFAQPDGGHISPFAGRWIAQTIREARWETHYWPDDNMIDNGTSDEGGGFGSSCVNEFECIGTCTATTVSNSAWDERTFQTSSGSVRGNACKLSSGNSAGDILRADESDPITTGTWYTLRGFIKGTRTNTTEYSGLRVMDYNGGTPVDVCNDADMGDGSTCDSSNLRVWIMPGGGDYVELTERTEATEDAYWIPTNGGALHTEWLHFVIKFRVPTSDSDIGSIQLDYIISAANLTQHIDEVVMYESVVQNGELNYIFPEGGYTMGVESDSRGTNYFSDLGEKFDDVAMATRPRFRWLNKVEDYTSAHSGQTARDTNVHGISRRAHPPADLNRNQWGIYQDYLAPSATAVLLGLNDAKSGASTGVIDDFIEYLVGDEDGGKSELDGGLTSGTASLTVIDGSSFPTANLRVQVGGERIFCSSRTGNALSGCARGLLGTRRQAHADATPVIETPRSTANQLIDVGTLPIIIEDLPWRGNLAGGADTKCDDDSGVTTNCAEWLTEAWRRMLHNGDLW